MKWQKKGLIFEPEKHTLTDECTEFAQSPQTLVFDDYVRIYFSTRKKEPENGMYLSFISYVDFSKDFSQILRLSDKSVIGLGELGTFDEHGIFPINPFMHEGKITAYTCGWNRRAVVPVETSIGLAISEDGGETFQRYGHGPVLTSSLKEPFLVGDGFVKYYEGTYHMWYIFGVRWMEETADEPVARVYKIGHATSPDGIQWEKEEGRQIIDDQLNEDECQALPTVLKIGDKYHMYFCYREATDFRTNPARGYRLGYAWSEDLKNWHREDDKAGIGLSTEGWDSEMMCYPHIFEVDGKAYLLYNGNKFGRFGFGLAELSSEE